jgi:hypothetical protein
MIIPILLHSTYTFTFFLGRDGIRTHDLYGTSVFKTDALTTQPLALGVRPVGIEPTFFIYQTNILTIKLRAIVVMGLEPTPLYKRRSFEPRASTNSATPTMGEIGFEPMNISM